jgi:hypothetical protein
VEWKNGRLIGANFASALTTLLGALFLEDLQEIIFESSFKSFK